ncbi:FecR family protein [Reyranella soli]|uniref:Sensor n=1 Tax=Reyranella soli TaxID=1230389 RepID=A0A512N5S7_9HYPH|nr:FecR family protein [Reyranella soli]GEP54344.1 sensor [Reyranella soli]
MTQPGDRDQIPDDISDAAQDWFLRLGAPGASAADRERFRAWCEADPRHAAAYDEVRAMWSQIDDLEPAFAPRGRPQPAPSTVSHRRGLSMRWRWGSAIAGLVAACVLIFVFAPAMMRLPTRLLADHSTAIGQQQTVALPDGSIAYLNTDTAIDVSFSERRRVVKLLHGEALFEVSKDAARPFDVLALDGKATAVGTAYAVGIADERATVTVTEGIVRVTSPDGSFDGPSTLTAGQQVSYRRGEAPQAVRTLDADAATSWRQGAIAIRNLPLADALAEIGRYHPGRIVLLGDGTRQAPVTARLSLTDIDGGIDALAATHGLTVTRITDFLLIVR